MQAVLRGAAKILFVAWVPVALLLVTSLAIAHQYSLPRPELQNPALQRGLARQRTAAPESNWMVTHVLYGACACSRRILAHLSSRSAMANLSEKVVLAGAARGDSTRALRARGFAVEVIAPEQLEPLYGLKVAPLLIISERSGAVRYLGGYTERKQGPRILDLEILRRLSRGAAVSALPLFGCAVSRSLQQLIDPWRIKYGDSSE
jgi:hypothetical protein